MNNYSIAESELELKTYVVMGSELLFPGTDLKLATNNYYLFPCVEPGRNLNERCARAGGEIRFEVTAINIGAMSTLGCYPPGRTSDTGKNCRTNVDCQGECRWFGGDVVMENSKASSTCTGYKKPLFIYERDMGFAKAADICGNIANNSVNGKKGGFEPNNFEEKADSIFREKITQILSDYWQNGKTEGLTDKLLTLVPTWRYVVLHHRITQNIGMLELNRFDYKIDSSKEKVLADLRIIKNENSWLIK